MIIFICIYVYRNMEMCLLKTNEMIAIPVRDTPVRNLMMANIRKDVDKALSTAKAMVAK